MLHSRSLGGKLMCVNLGFLLRMIGSLWLLMDAVILSAEFKTR